MFKSDTALINEYKQLMIICRYSTWRTYLFGVIKSKLGDAGVNISSSISGELGKDTRHSEDIKGRELEKILGLYVQVSTIQV